MKKIFILAPCKFTSGGPELLHQLCFNLNTLGFNSYMTYVDGESKQENIPFQYLKYDVLTSDVVDSDENLLVIPESYFYYINKFNKIKKSLWWLSVDNFYQYHKEYRVSYFKKLNIISRILIKSRIIKSEIELIENKLYNGSVFHLVQSFYAKQHLNSKKISSLFLSDYISDVYSTQTYDLDYKQNIILYNPKKGYSNIKEYLDIEIDAIWIPITDMPQRNILKIMSMSKLFIDFGNHPGKDRLPREAALMGCCIITNRSGSAFYTEDVCIPDEFKFDPVHDKISVIKSIEKCLHDFKNENLKFSTYRNTILQEKNKFREDCISVFSQLLV